MYRVILVPLDRSLFAEQAAHVAALIAPARNAIIHLVMVHTHPEWRSEAGRPQLYVRQDDARAKEERAYLESAGERLQQHTSAKVETDLLEGAVGSAVVKFAADKNVELIVMSTHGRGGLERVWLGSVTDAVLRHAHIPLLVVRPIGEPATADAVWPQDARVPAHGFRRIVAALDGDELAERALEAALDLPLAPDAEFTAMRAVRPPAYPVSPFLPHTARATKAQLRKAKNEADDYLAALEKRHPDVRMHALSVVTSVPADAILKRADDLEADLIVLGTHARGGIVRAVLGSVADHVIRGAYVPVFVMPASAHGVEHVEVSPELSNDVAL